MPTTVLSRIRFDSSLVNLKQISQLLASYIL